MRMQNYNLTTFVLNSVTGDLSTNHQLFEMDAKDCCGKRDRHKVTSYCLLASSQRISDLKMSLKAKKTAKKAWKS